MSEDLVDEDESIFCSTYGMTKTLAESLIRHWDKDYLIFRMFNIVGTSGYPELDKIKTRGLDRLFESLYQGKLEIYGADYDTKDGSGERDYVSLIDTCRAFVLGIEKLMGEDGIKEIINIGSGVKTSVLEISKLWVECGGELEVEVKDRRKGDPASVVGVVDKAWRVLGWKSVDSMEDIVRRCIEDRKRLEGAE